ncbi:MAG: NAD-dependent epimerase/dehydratase [Deltaproteobacteria bacterium]|nr:NAD-dependent epimerase/dehydratase [Deltaproteobacteria bacterium]
MKRVLLTGATGFIGRACLGPLRDRGFEIHAIRHERAASARDVTWHDCDLLTADPAPLIAAIRPTHLLHLAWYAVPGKYWTSRENLRWVRASLALYEAFVAAGGSRVVMGGSAAEYDWSHGVCRERETPVVPRTYYGRCKHALAQLIDADAEQAGISAAWARFFFLYGPHEYENRLVPSVILALLRGEVARCSPGTQQRDFLHVDDAAAATVALLDSEVRGPVNIASGAPVAVRSLAEQVATLVGSGSIDFGAIAADPNDPPLLIADVRRLRDEVGFTASAQHAQRLGETVAWWRANAGAPR